VSPTRNSQPPTRRARCPAGPATIHEERNGSRHWHGYLWYDEQGIESLACSRDGSVYLGDGAYPPADFDQAAYAALSRTNGRPGHQDPAHRRTLVPAPGLSSAR
jgi:hypothetical protein